MNKLPMREREPFLHLSRGLVDLQDGAVVLNDATGTWMQIPVGMLACLMLELGITITNTTSALAPSEIDSLYLDG